MQQTRPLTQEPEALPPSLVHVLLSSQIPVSLMGDVQLVKGTNKVPHVLVLNAVNFFLKNKFSV
jgi:hypothetical protein